MKLQLKRSNVLDGTSAKEPTAAQVEYGELCVNYNTNDPALFIKDSNDVIIRIAGAGSVGEGETPSGPILPDTGNKPGDVFFNETNNTLYYWNGSDWVPIASQENAADIFVGTFDEVDAAIAVDDRANGLLLWETTEGQLYIWYIDADTKQWVQAVPASGGGGGGSSVSVLPNAPSVAAQGDLWYCTSDGRLYVYYDDNATTQWVDASPDDIAPVVHSGEIWPSTATEDDLFFNTTDGRLYIYYNDGDSLQWVDASPDTQNYTDDWVRDGTTLKPANDGDDISVGAGTFSGDVIVSSTGVGRGLNVSTDPAMLIEGTDFSSTTQLIANNSTTGHGILAFGRSRGGMGSFDSVNQDDTLGRIDFYGATGTEYELGASIQGRVQGVPSAGVLTTAIDFNTNNGTNFDRRMLLNPGGDLQIGGTLPANPNITLNTDGRIDATLWRFSQQTGWNVDIGYDGGNRIFVSNGANGVSLDPNAQAWAAYSQRSLKTALIPITSGLDKVSTLSAVTGRFKADKEGISRSFLIADEVQQVLPEAVSGSGTEEDPLSLRYTEVIPLLVSALQDAKDRIEALEAEVQQLKGGN